MLQFEIKFKFKTQLIQTKKILITKNMNNVTDSNTLNTEEGNNKPPPKSLRRLCFTLNNPNDTAISDIIEKCENRNYFYCIGNEVGEQGTPHLQGYIEFPNPKLWQTCINLLPGAHIIRCKGTRKQNLIYCKKDGDFRCNFPVPLEEQVLAEYASVEWRPWQQEVLDMYVTTPDNRSVHWYTDILGNNGKSFLTRYLVVKENVLVANGKKCDVFHQVAKRLENEDEQKPFKMVILDIPRHQQEFTNYGLLEELKNGLIVSGKYEGGTFVFPSPHVVVMSNSHPDWTKFSNDRWIHKEL